MAVVACSALVLGACGGDDDDDADADGDSSTTTVASDSSTTTAAPTTTLAPATTTTLAPLDLVTEGATVVVANASGIDGAAGRMTDALAEVGFTTGTATNSSEGPLETTKIYHDPESENALPVAESVRLALGGGDIEVLELAVPAPTDTGELGDDVTVLVAMGNDTADKTLDELQGRVAAPAPDDSGDEDTGDEDTGDESTGEETGEETGDESTGEETGDESTGEETSDS